MKKINFAFGTLEYRSGILYFIIKDDAHLDAAEIDQLFAACREMSDNKPFLLISDARVHVDITPKGRKAASKKELGSLIIANAVLVNSPAVRLVANVFSKINRPPFPYQVFNDEEKALRWLKQYKNAPVLQDKSLGSPYIPLK